jgi:hypothetical protein
MKSGPTADTVFTGKVVKEGIFTVQILYANGDGYVHHTATDLPFMVEAAIPGVHPGMKVENQLMQLEEQIRPFQGGPHENRDCLVFDIKVHARFLIRVTQNVARSGTPCACYGYSTRSCGWS